MTVQVSDVKKALCIDIDDDDEIIQTYIDNATEYIKTAVSETADLTKYKQFDYAVTLLTQFWYLNRDIDMKKQPFQVVSLIQQLKSKVISIN
ncbi:head-tail connector protein [Ligilactobacillus cholophilus]|uniref:head-tail connector protein n=1 Tax=Ligilactobacillus cholophilus TaxID=3050131 RepID=UPI0025B0DC1C|nr:head-tail connector protein [Ligilactobacillus cholophilus]